MLHENVLDFLLNIHEEVIIRVCYLHLLLYVWFREHSQIVLINYLLLGLLGFSQLDSTQISIIKESNIDK